MNPAIKQYLDEHGATYTSDALRRGLLDAGYDPAEVNAALHDWQSQPVDAAPPVGDRRQFWRWAFGLHAAVLVLIAVASLVIGSFAAGSWGLLIVLAVVLLIGLGISGLVGRGLVRGSGLVAALSVPAASALLIGGSCLALGGSYLLRAPPRTGVMELKIDPPLSFEGSGVARCDNFGGVGAFSVWADNLGTLDGSIVSVTLESGVAPDPTSPKGPGLSITLYPPSGAKPPPSYIPVGYAPIFSTVINIDASADGRSGTLRFEGLEPSAFDQPPGQVPGLEPISGTVTWNCT
jgi:hypothetical protein